MNEDQTPQSADQAQLKSMETPDQPQTMTHSAEPLVAPSGPTLTPEPSVAAAQPLTPAQPTIQSIYPDISSSSSSPAAPSFSPQGQTSREVLLAEATSSYHDSMTLVLGLASAGTYVLILYFVKNLWLTIGVSSVIALLAIYFGIKNYNSSGKVSPLGSCGVSSW